MTSLRHTIKCVLLFKVFFHTGEKRPNKVSQRLANFYSFYCSCVPYCLNEDICHSSYKSSQGFSYCNPQTIVKSMMYDSFTFFFIIYRDLFGLVVGSTGQRDSKSGTQSRARTKVSTVQDDHDNFMRRSAGFFKTLISIIQQLLQLLQKGRRRFIQNA